MKITCLTVGKKHQENLAGAIKEFEKRLSGYTEFAFEFIPVSDTETESSQILKRVRSDDAVLLLDETGIMLNNKQLAETIGKYQNNSVKRLIIIIGGAYGVNAGVKDRSNLVLSLSKQVFPHQIVRLMLVEQLYRSFNLLAGGKYHHE